MPTTFLVALIPPFIYLFLHLLAVVMSNYGNHLILSWMMDNCLRDLYIYYYSYNTTSFSINVFFLLLNSYNTSWKIKSSATMGNVLPSSSCNMDALLRPFFPEDTINNIIHFLTSIHESIVYATGVRWYIYPI